MDTDQAEAVSILLEFADCTLEGLRDAMVSGGHAEAVVYESACEAVRALGLGDSVTGGTPLRVALALACL
jgi:hypothetical protein